MKFLKFAFAATIIAGSFIAAFAFTTSVRKITPDTWFKFIGNPVSGADIKNPNKYVKAISEPVGSVPSLYLYAIKADQLTEIYPPTDLVYPNKPIVNVANALQADILSAIENQTPIPDRVIFRSNP